MAYYVKHQLLSGRTLAVGPFWSRDAAEQAADKRRRDYAAISRHDPLAPDHMRGVEVVTRLDRRWLRYPAERRIRTRQTTPGKDENMTEPVRAAPPSREAHLAWCKQRAKKYADRGDGRNAWASFASDMRKHPETRQHIGLELGMVEVFAGVLNLDDAQAVWEFIAGFN